MTDLTDFFLNRSRILSCVYTHVENWSGFESKSFRVNYWSCNLLPQNEACYSLKLWLNCLCCCVTHVCSTGWTHWHTYLHVESVTAASILNTGTHCLLQQLKGHEMMSHLQMDQITVSASDSQTMSIPADLHRPPIPSARDTLRPHRQINVMQQALISKDRKVRIKVVVMETTQACFTPTKSMRFYVCVCGGPDVASRTPVPHSDSDPLVLHCWADRNRNTVRTNGGRRWRKDGETNVALGSLSSAGGSCCRYVGVYCCFSCKLMMDRSWIRMVLCWIICSYNLPVISY